jgi:ureidoglycolate lyase
MKLLRVGNKGAEKPAILHSDGTYRDLSSVVPDITGATITAEGLGRIRAADIGKLPVLDSKLRIGPCVGNVG